MTSWIGLGGWLGLEKKMEWHSCCSHLCTGGISMIKFKRCLTSKPTYWILLAQWISTSLLQKRTSARPTDLLLVLLLLGLLTSTSQHDCLKGGQPSGPLQDPGSIDPTPHRLRVLLFVVLEVQFVLRSASSEPVGLGTGHPGARPLHGVFFYFNATPHTANVDQTDGPRGESAT